MPARNSVRYVRYLRVLPLLALAGLAHPASAQNALGDGRALEQSLRTPTPGVPQGQFNRSFARELMFREAIVTGAAPGGYSFRGTRLPSQFEFRGELGDDALYSYRRDSLYSGLAGRGIRGTEALQYQFSLSVGSQVPPSLAGPISYGRAGTTERGFDPDMPLNRDLTSLNTGLSRVQLEPDDQLLSAVEMSSPLVQPVRSVSTFMANRSLQPTLVGMAQNRNTQQTAGQTASPLTGVQLVPLTTLREPQRLPVVQMPASTLTEPAETPRAGATDATGATTGAGQTTSAYQGLMERFQTLTGSTAPRTDPAAQAQGRPTNEQPEWARDLIDLRRMLRGLPSTAQVLGLQEGDEGEIEAAARGIQNPLLDADSNPDGPSNFDIEVLRRLRQAGGVTESLIPATVPNVDMYTAHMRRGQDLLAQGRYFDAEERFISAMSSRPGDVNAQIGRVHAQLGGGLFLSGGLNLRQLIVSHPEVAAMRYAEDLLPEQERIERLIPMLRDGASSPAAGADSGLLLGYLGFQIERPDLMKEGLAALREHGDPDDQRLAEFLEGVWMEAAAANTEDGVEQGAEEGSNADG